MALNGTITIHGASAGAVFHDSGPLSFSPFTKYSAFLSDQFSFSSTGYHEVDSGSLTLISKKAGDLVFSDTDTISASYGGDTVISGSVAVSFVFGTSTTSLFSTPFSDTLTGASSAFAAASNSTLTGAAADLKSLSAELLKPAAATVGAAASTVMPTLAAPTGTSIDLGDAKVNIVKLEHKS